MRFIHKCIYYFNLFRAACMIKFSRIMAVKILENILKRHPDDVLVLHTLGCQYYHLKSYKQAIEKLEKTNEITESFIECFTLGDIYRLLEDKENAARNYRLAISEIDDKYKEEFGARICKAQLFLDEQK